jgi:hypothetical protein
MAESDGFGQNTDAIVDFAVAAVALIAIVGAVSSYFEKYLTTSVSQWVAHDLTEAPESLFPALSKKPTHDSNCTRRRTRQALRDHLREWRALQDLEPATSWYVAAMRVIKSTVGAPRSVPLPARRCVVRKWRGQSQRPRRRRGRQQGPSAEHFGVVLLQ